MVASVNNDAKARKPAKLTPATWPDALPLPYEEKIFSILCGNSTLKWCLHEGVGLGFKPTCFWETELVTKSDLEDGSSPTALLSRLLTPPALSVVFGPNFLEQATKQSALERSRGRTATLLSVYVIFTNSENAEYLAWCFSEIPTRLFNLNADDFFTTSQGRYDTMGIDRLACIRGAGCIGDFPTLVIDGGTSMTYTACDQKGQIVGGGITVGILARFEKLAENTNQAPGMVSARDPKEMFKSFESLVVKNEQLGYFERATDRAVYSAFSKEIGLFLNHLAKQYLDDMSVSTTGDEGKGGTTHAESSLKIDLSWPRGLYQHMNPTPSAEKFSPTVFVTGGDCHLLEGLLTMHEGEIFKPSPQNRPYTICRNKHLHAVGIAAVLYKNVQTYKELPFNETDKKLLGCRIAKEFKLPDEDGNRVYRGTISVAIRDKKRDSRHYLVVYDDNDTEELNLVQIHAALTLYAQVGEKAFKKRKEAVAEKISEKQGHAQAAAKQLEINDDTKAKVQANVNRFSSASVTAASVPLPKKLSAIPMVPTVNTTTTPAEAAVTATTPTKRKPNETSISGAKKAKVNARPYGGPLSFVNKRIAKRFENQIFFGTVSGYDDNEKLWRIDYDDGDEEEFDMDELKDYFRLYESHRDVDRNGKYRIT